MDFHLFTTTLFATSLLTIPLPIFRHHVSAIANYGENSPLHHRARSVPIHSNRHSDSTRCLGIAPELHNYLKHDFFGPHRTWLPFYLSLEDVSDPLLLPTKVMTKPAYHGMAPRIYDLSNGDFAESATNPSLSAMKLRYDAGPTFTVTPNALSRNPNVVTVGDVIRAIRYRAQTSSWHR